MRLDLVRVGCLYLMHIVAHSLYVFCSLAHLRESGNVIRDYLDSIQTRNSFPRVTFLAHGAPLATSQCHKQRQYPHLSSPGDQSFPYFLPLLTSVTGWRELTSDSTDNELPGKLSLVFDFCSFSDRGLHTLRRKPHFLSYILAFPSFQLCSLLSKIRIEALSI